MKKTIILLAFFLNIGYICLAQPPRGERFKKAEMLLENYISKEVNLTPDELQKLKPVYKNYIMEIRGVKKENNSDPIATEEKLLNIRKKYKEDFRKILGTDERVNKLLLAERNFRDILRKELIERRLNKRGNDKEQPAVQ